MPNINILANPTDPSQVALRGGTEDVDVDTPSGEGVTVTVPRGLSDEDVHSLLRQKHPNLFVKPDQGILPTAWSDIKGMWPKSPEAIQSDVKSMSSSERKQAIQQAPYSSIATQEPIRTEERKAAGYSLPYRIAAGSLEATTPVNVQGMEQAAAAGHPKEVIGHALGGIATTAGPILAGEAIRSTPENVRTGLQKTFGIGDRFIREGASAIGDENAAAIVKHEEKVADIQQANQQHLGDYQQRQNLKGIADTHAQAVADRLPQVREKAKAEAQAMYPDIDGESDSAKLHEKLQSVVETKLQGSSKVPGVLTRIMGELEPPPSDLSQASVYRGAGAEARGGGVKAAGNLADLPPAARAKMLQQMSEPERAAYEAPQNASAGTTTPFKKLQGYASELYSASNSSSLLPDERATLRGAWSVVKEEMRGLAEPEGKLDELKAADKNWQQYENTFNNTKPAAKGGSPIARALQARDPITGKLRPDYVQGILSDDKAYPVAQELLGRYKHLGAPTNELDVMKTNLDAASELPKSVNWKQEPQAPEMQTYDPVEARKVELKAKGLGTSKGFGAKSDVWAVIRGLGGNASALAYPIVRRMLASGIGSEGVLDWLSKATPNEMEMAKDISLRKVALKRK